MTKAPLTATRVLMVGPSLDILGGQAVQAQRLMRVLGSSDRIEVRFLPVNPRLPRPLNSLQRVRYLRTVVTSVAFLVALLRSVPRADVLHIFSASYYSYLLSALPPLLLGRLFGRPTVLNYHSGEADDHLQNWPISRRTIAALATEIVVPSGYLVAVFARHGLPASSISNNVPFESFVFRKRETFVPHFLSNRNLEALYDVGTTIRAFALIVSAYPQAKLRVIGDGAERAALERLVAELNLHGVEFLGRIPNAEMPSHYAWADIYLNSPLIDNMPLSILEAFACGLPVASTNAGGIPYIVRDGETGLLVVCRDHVALANAALRYLQDWQSASAIALAARQECQQRYDMTSIRLLWEEIYFRLQVQERRP